MKNEFEKVHSTSKRARYKCSLLKDKSIDENILKTYLEKISGVVSVRVNKNAYSVIFYYEDETICSEIEEKLSNLSVDELLKNCNEIASVCISCVSDEEPSIKRTAIASSAIVAEQLYQMIQLN